MLLDSDIVSIKNMCKSMTKQYDDMLINYSCTC